MSIFGTTYPKLVVSSSLLEIPLEESKVNYEFFGADVVEHTSVFTGKRNYPYKRNRSSFEFDIILQNYSSSQAVDKFNAIYQNRNSAFLFYPHNNSSASQDVWNEPIPYYITEFVPYYLSNDMFYDVLKIRLEPRKNSVLDAIDTALGYGYTYGANYGTGL